jgi:HemY protein
VAYERWSPVSPTTGQLDVMRWGVPEAGASDKAAATALAAKLEAMLGLGATSEPRVDAPAAPPAPEPVVVPAPPLVAGAPGSAEPPAKLLPAVPAPPPPARIEPSRGENTGATDAAAIGETMPVPVEPVRAPARPPARKPVEPRIFVSPRAPDDPGTEAPDLDDLTGYPSKA